MYQIEALFVSSPPHCADHTNAMLLCSNVVVICMSDEGATCAVDLGGMQGSLNKMAPASRQWRQAADWARELAHLVDSMQTWLARQLTSSLPFQKVS